MPKLIKMMESQKIRTIKKSMESLHQIAQTTESGFAPRRRQHANNGAQLLSCKSRRLRVFALAASIALDAAALAAAWKPATWIMGLLDDRGRRILGQSARLEITGESPIDRAEPGAYATLSE